jgi:ATP-dependent DNA helicase DinG
MEKKAAILVRDISDALPESPAHTLSPLNLKDDLSRFQIITKVPYPNKGDRWTEAKRKIDEDWYYWQTALRLVQGYGRSVGSKEDWAKTYVLDSAFGYFVKKNRKILPDWFTEAIQAK